MVRKCCVPTCDLAQKCETCKVALSYFKPPRDPAVVKKWELALGLKNHFLTSKDRICSSHFKKCDIFTKRYISMKRPSTNSKMILEITTLVKDTIPMRYDREAHQCNHGKEEKGKVSPVDSGASRGDDDSNSESTEDDEEPEVVEVTEERRNRLTRRDYRTAYASVKNRSRRRKIRVLRTLRLKWLKKGNHLEQQIRLLDEKIHELTAHGRQESRSA